MSFFPPKDPVEKEFFAFDFAALLSTGESIVGGSAQFTIEVDVGTDPDPSAMLSGVPVYSGAKVSHLIIGGVSGTTYLLSCKVTTTPNGQELKLSETVHVRNQGEW